MSTIDQITFNQIVNLLVPHCIDNDNRKTIVQMSLQGCTVIAQLKFDGTAENFTVHLVETLLRFGQFADESTITLLLKHLKTRVGVDQHLQIDALIAKLPTEKMQGKAPEITDKAQGHVFIAYSSKNIEIIRRLTTDLLNVGVNVWVDVMALTPQTPNWQQSIRAAIRSADVILYMGSPDAVDSPYVQGELLLAKENGKPIFALWVAGEKWSNCAPLELLQAQYIDLRQNYETQITELYTALGVRLKPATVSAPTPTHTSLAELQEDYIHFFDDENWSAARYILDRISRLPNVPQRWLEREYKQLEHANKLQPESPPPIVIPPRRNAYDILPKPFEWVAIPAGQVVLEKGGYLSAEKTFPVSAFDMAKYPITNAQFEPFIKAGGYNKQQYWTSDGWTVKVKEKWAAQLYWANTKWNGAEYPVVGISWYEAYAYTRWLSDVSGEMIQLPTEQEWQRAAQGDAGLTYPWGHEWDGSRCNNNVDSKGVGKTTPVTEFKNGASPYGALDMAGNVWEWCLTNFETGTSDANGTNMRALRGGSWDDSDTNKFRAVFRDRDHPLLGDPVIGFRVARAYT